MYKRLILADIKEKLFNGKIIIIAGPRQVGKTTLALEILKDYDHSEAIKFNCDDPDEREMLNNKNLENLKLLIGPAKLIFIDEGQKVETIGQTLKLLVDEFGGKKQIIVTGSSTFNLLDNTGEVLTGRKRVYYLYPLGLEEMYADSRLRLQKDLESIMIYGSYPEVVNSHSQTEKKEALKELSGSYLYKDILEFQQVKSSDFLRRLLKALALQIGSEVSYTELSGLLGADKKTIERYVDLLEKNFIIFRLPPYYTNPRKEISKLRKIYFYDVGIRNAIINNFNDLDSRMDGGHLWENLAIIERLKYLAYHQISSNNYFWRAYNKAEVDWVEERDGQVFGYELKFKKRNLRPPRDWQNKAYQIITPDDLAGFVL